MNAVWFGLSTLLFYLAYWMLVAPILRNVPLGSRSVLHTVLMGLLWGLGLAALLFQPPYRGWGHVVWAIFVGMGVIAPPPSRRWLYEGDRDRLLALVAAVVGFTAFTYLVKAGSPWAIKVAAPYIALFSLRSVGKAALAYFMLPVVSGVYKALIGVLQHQRTMKS